MNDDFHHESMLASLSHKLIRCRSELSKLNAAHVRTKRNLRRVNTERDALRGALTQILEAAPAMSEANGFEWIRARVDAEDVLRQLKSGGLRNP